MKHGAPKFGILFSSVFSTTSKYIPDSEEDNLKLRNGFQQPIFYSYGILESDSDYVTKAVIEEGDYTLVIHKYGHNIPKFIGEDMSIFGNFLKKVYEIWTNQKFELDTDSFTDEHKKEYQSFIDSQA